MLIYFRFQFLLLGTEGKTSKQILGTMTNIFAERRFLGSRVLELKTYQGTSGFINEDQDIKSKKIKGSWEYVPPLDGLTNDKNRKHPTLRSLFEF